MTVRELQNELLELKRSSASNTVAAALLSLQQELAKPPPVFDPYRALAGLKSLVDLARDKADARTKRFSTILRQCRPLLGNPHFQGILLKLVGDKEDIEVGKAIQKSLRPSASLWPHVPPPTQSSSCRSPDFRYRPRSSQSTCFSCRRRGHIARFCPRNWYVHMLVIYFVQNKCLPVWLLSALLFYFGFLLPLSIWSIWDGFSKLYPILCLWRGPWIGLVGGSPFFSYLFIFVVTSSIFSLFLDVILVVWPAVETGPKIC